MGSKREGTTGRRSYSKEQKRAAVADVASLGVVDAAAKHGVPESCLSRWHRGENGGVAPQQVSVRDPEPTDARWQSCAGAAPAPPSEPPDEVTAKPTSTSPATPGAEVTSRRTAKVTPKRRVAKAYTPSQREEILEYVAKHSVTEAHEKYGPARCTIYQWQRNVTKAAQGEATSPTGGESTTDVEAQRDREILDEWRKHPGLGPSQVKNQLRRKGVKVSVQTTRRVMEEQGYRPPKVKREPHDQRYEAVRPNHLWHLDFVHRHINRASTFTLILLDDCSRFVPGHGVDDAERADLVIGTFEAAVERHGKPEMVMSDRGSAFWSWRGISRFTALLTELGIDHIEAKHKEWNGKVEVFNANLHKELFDVQRFYDLAEMRRKLTAHLHWYNHARTSHALGGLLVPADRYYGRAEDVLARIEAGAGRDPSDELDLRNRCLEIFKVTSTGGVTELWLMGKKLLGRSS